MATIFYDHLIDWQKLHSALEILEIDAQEKLEALEHCEEIVHTEVLIVILRHLPEEKHQIFLQGFHAAPYDEKHLLFLEEHAPLGIAAKIKERASEIIREVLSELFHI